MTRPKRAMILAAGYGTRLGALSQRVPKPMLPICGAPLVRWSVLWLRAQGIREIVINLHHLGEQIEAELGDGRALEVDIAYSPEHGEILGTGGGLRKARPLLDDGSGAPILAVNGKIMLDLDLDPVIARHRSCAAEATMVLRADPKAEDWGSLRLDAQGHVTGFLGATLPDRDLGAPLMFTGVQMFQPEFLDRIPAEGEQCIVRTAYKELFYEGRGLAGYCSDEYWWEHSTRERYLAGIANVLSGRARLEHAATPLRGVDPTATVAASAQLREPLWIGPGAVVGDGAVVGPNVQLGAGAIVEPNAVLRDAAVWAGGTAAGTVENTVVLGP